MAECKLCKEPCADWQLYCGAACCAAYEMGIRDLSELEDDEPEEEVDEKTNNR